MANRLIPGTLVACAMFFASTVANAAPPVQALQEVTSQRQNEMLPMRDGARLWTSIHFPKEMQGRAPAILIRTPYQFEMESTLIPSFLTDLATHGYVIVFQNERGRFWSEGEYRIISNSAEDGYDTVDWLARQPWSNGKVGTLGCSSSGDSQIKLATLGHPAHAAALTISSGSSVGKLGRFHEQGAFYRGGVPQVPWWTWYASLGQSDFPKFPEGISDRNRDWLDHSLRHWMAPPETAHEDDELVRHLPSMDVVRSVNGPDTELEKLIRRLPNDPAWDQEVFLNEGDPYEVPTLWVFQAYDIGLSPNVAAFEYALNRSGEKSIRDSQFMLISAKGHCSMLSETENTINGERDVGDARYPYVEAFRQWFDFWLKGEKNDALHRPRAEVFVSGQNQWRQFPSWPPPGVHEVSYYLDNNGKANSRLGDGRLIPVSAASDKSDSFDYDPRYPVPSVGGDVCCVGGHHPGSYDQSIVELRNDVLVYTSEPVKEAVTVVGWVEAILHVSSDVADTDFTVKLVDVYPDGRAFNVGDTIQRARWRDGYDQPRLMNEAEVYEVRVGPFFISNRFEAGHRIRLDITSSNFPRYERNLNTGGNNFDEEVGRIARNTIHIGPDHPSRIVLSAVPGSGVE